MIMDDERFQARLADWQAMPGNCEDESYLAQRSPGPLDAKFDALCWLYLEAEPPRRETLSRLFAHVSGGAAERSAPYARCDNLLNYIRRLAWRLTAARDRELARLGLAAAALAAEGADARDILQASAFLKHAAAQTGIDLAPMIEALAATVGPHAQRILTALRKSDDATITRIIRYHEGTG